MKYSIYLIVPWDYIAFLIRAAGAILFRTKQCQEIICVKEQVGPPREEKNGPCSKGMRMWFPFTITLFPRRRCKDKRAES